MWKDYKRNFIPFIGNPEDLTDALDFYLPDSEIEGCRCKLCLEPEETYLLIGIEAPPPKDC